MQSSPMGLRFSQFSRNSRQTYNFANKSQKRFCKQRSLIQELLRPSWSDLGAFLGLLRALLGLSWTVFGHSWDALGAFLGRSQTAVKRFWCALKRCWTFLGALGRSGATFGCFWGTLLSIFYIFLVVWDATWAHFFSTSP